MSQACPELGVSPGEDVEARVSQLYREESRYVLSYVTNLLRDRHLAEDVVQETMLRAWRHCDEFSQEKGSVRGWLLKVAHNIAVDKIRMRAARPREITHNSASLAQVQDHADRVVTALQIRAALDRLSPQHRAVVELMYMYGCTAREVGGRLGIPEGTVYSRAFYALRILRQEIGLTIDQSGAVVQAA